MYEDAARRAGLTQDQCDRVKRAARRVVERTRLLALAQGRSCSEAAIHDLCVAEGYERVATYRSLGDDPASLADWLDLPELAASAVQPVTALDE
jgi:hypothetical protein